MFPACNLLKSQVAARESSRSGPGPEPSGTHRAAATVAPMTHLPPMPAYLVGTITVRDPALWAEYVGRVGATFAPHGGELVFRGERALQFAGAPAAPRIVCARFPSLQALRAWHDSPDYQALVPLREAAADVALTAYEG